MPSVKGFFNDLRSTQGRFYLGVRLLGILGIKMQGFYLVNQPLPDPLLPTVVSNKIQVKPINALQYNIDWFPRPKEVIDARFAQGARCWVAFQENEAIGCIWFSPGPFEDDIARLRFIPKPSGIVAWDFDVYVVPQRRFGKAFMLLWQVAGRQMRESGYLYTASRIDFLNNQSLASHKRLGASVTGRVLVFSIGSVEFTVHRSRCILNLNRSNFADLDLPSIHNF